ncbi:MAG TPA: hypothetical protein VL326_24785 [Kofleriaceae bacterium]|jgi:hypothetical protein|nr:hypothetical protein [Kofleriaceae bacterium]
MRPWVLLALAACSPSREQPPAAHHEGSGSASRHSIDLTVQYARISIRGVEIARSGKNLELGYRIEGTPDAVVPAEILCRVHGYNLIYPRTTSGKGPGPRLTALFKPDPFDDVPQICEVRFTLVSGGVPSNITNPDRVFAAPSPSPIARACFRDELLVDGACPEDSFPVAEKTNIDLLQGRPDIQVEHGKLELGDDAAVLTAMFTKHDIASQGRYAVHLSCADAGGPIVGEAAFAILPLDRMEAGTSVYGPVPILLDRKPKPLAACDLRIISRATQGPPNERAHAEYCVTTAAIRVGRCTPN